MATPPETEEAPAPPEREERQDGVEVCLFDESSEGFSRAVRAISELTAGQPEPRFHDAEVERLASSVTFLREWRHFSYEAKDVSFTNGTEHKITLPQYSSASVPQITRPLGGMDSTDRSDFILFAGGNVWALDWCPRLYDKPYSPVNCEYLAVAAHPPSSSYHKLGLPLTGRGIIQVWCLIAPFEEVNPHQPVFACNKKSRRGRPSKTPEENNCVESSSNPPKPRGRPRKRTITTSDDHSEPSLKRPRGRPRKYPLPVARVEDFSIIDPPVTSTVVPGDLELACVMPTVVSVESTPKSGRGRPRKKPIDKIKDFSGIELKRDMSTTQICLEPKKKRGRPRKYPAPSNSKYISSTGTELGKDTTFMPVSVGCSLGPNGSTDSNPNLAVVAVDASLPVPSSSSAICAKKSRGQRGRGQPKKETISGAPCCSVVSGISLFPKDISLPRVVLCLAHNGKVAWDIKWKPPLPCQSGQKSCLGFLAILLGNGSLEVWEVPSPSMIQSIYSSAHSMEGTDPRFLKLQPVFRCARVNCGSRQSIPLTVDWSPSPPHDMILAGCHDGTVALWKFNTDLSSQDSKPFMCITAESVPIRALSWAPYISEEGTSTFVTAGEDGLKFWDLRDPYRPLWELATAPRAVLSLHWLKDARGIVISLEDGTLKFLNLLKMANDVPVTGRPFIGTKTQGVSTYKLSEYLIWSIHASETTGYAAYCVADGTAVRFQLTSRFWEKEPGRNRVPYFLCGSVLEEKTAIKIGVMLQNSPLSNVPLMSKKGPKSCQNVEPMHDIEKEKLPLTNSGYNCTVNPEVADGQQDGHDQGQNTGAIVLADPTMQQNTDIYDSSDGKSPQDFEVFPPKAVALHRLRWNMNKGSERWLCYGGAAGIIRFQRI